jgi:tetratricopeptide (TPR) repeat protein
MDVRPGSFAAAGRSRRGPTAAVCALALLVSIAPAAAQDLRQYQSLVLAYAAGDDQAIDQMLEWSRPWLDEALQPLNKASDPWQPWRLSRIAAATMLHTDAAIRLLEVDKTTEAETHLDFASRLLHRTVGAAELRHFAGLWYVAMSRYLRRDLELSLAERLLESGRNRLPGDARVLRESGVLQELLAGRPSLSTLPELSGSTRETAAALTQMMSRRTNHLGVAATRLKSSLQADASDAETRLHLGRVLMLQDDQTQALAMFSALRTDAADPDVAYLAHLFAGAAHEREGRLEPAAAAYREALARIPAAQAAYIALSQVLQRIGRSDEARAINAQLLAEPRAPRYEPMWTYFFPTVEAVQDGLTELRQEARR